MNFHVLTLFPEMIMNAMQSSIIGRAIENGSITVEAVNIRDFAFNKHMKVDDYPYGGGAGMLMQAEPVYLAWESVTKKIEKPCRTVFLTPQGKTFTQAMAREMAAEEDLIFLCGHYEGIDERVLEEIVTDPVSIGDYVLTGGELPASIYYPYSSYKTRPAAAVGSDQQRMEFCAAAEKTVERRGGRKKE